MSESHVEPWVDAKTAGKHVGLSSDKMRVLAREGKMPAMSFKNGARDYWRFKISQVDEFMNQQANVSRVA